MRKICCAALSVALCFALSGCGKPTETGESSKNPSPAVNSQAKLDGPAAATMEFLEALRTGDDEKAASLLTADARKNTVALNRNITPSASDTAKFYVGKVDYADENGARVACEWTDDSVDGKQKTDRAVWVLRREEAGWRIAGMAYELFPGEQPLILNFENREDMERQQQWAREESRRRDESEALQAKEDKKNKNSALR
jgi:hypothetical protein